MEEGAQILDTEPQAPIMEHQALDITLRAQATEPPAKGIMHPAKGTTLQTTTTTTTSSAAAILVVAEAVEGASQVNPNV